MTMMMREHCVRTDLMNGFFFKKTRDIRFYCFCDARRGGKKNQVFIKKIIALRKIRRDDNKREEKNRHTNQGVLFIHNLQEEKEMLVFFLSVSIY